MPPYLTGPHLQELQRWYDAYLQIEEVEANDALITTHLAADQYFDERFYQTLLETPLWRAGPYCAVCLDLHAKWPTSDSRETSITISYTLQLIASAAGAGCRSCAFWLGILRSDNLLRAFFVAEQRLLLLAKSCPVTLSVSGNHDVFYPTDKTFDVWLDLPGRQGKESWRSGGTASRKGCVAVQKLPAQVEYKNDSIDVARQWLDNCTQNHTLCHSNRRFLQPTRLLHIERMSLVLTSDLHEMPKYATVSYIWGTIPFEKLLCSNLDIFCQRIPALPPTLRDAVSLAGSLGLSYIWIDAVCIIQDSTEDWLHESARMRDIYGGSYVNICASSAAHVFQGFDVHTRPDGWIVHYRDRIITVLDTPFLGSYDFISGKLKSRSWILQELLLTSRNLYVGEYGFKWQCKDLTASQALPGGCRYGELGPSMLTQEQGWDWSDIVSAFSRANLTYDSDKMSALSGIARRHHEITGHEYVAGMWRESLIGDLAWLPSMDGGTPLRKWRAPSWSWLAYEDKFVQYRSRRHTQEYASVHDLEIDHQGPDIFGPLTRAALTLRYTTLFVGKRIVDVPRAGEARVVTVEVSSLQENFDFLPDLFEASDTIDETSYLLPLVRHQFELDLDGGKISVIEILGLVLIPNGAPGASYRRVGAFRTHAVDGTQGTKDEVPFYKACWKMQSALHADLQRSDAAEKLVTIL